jgi:hypothetical protein
MSLCMYVLYVILLLLYTVGIHEFSIQQKGFVQYKYVRLKNSQQQQQQQQKQAKV